MALNSLATSLAIEQKDIQINVLIADEAKTEMNQISKTSPKTILPMLKKILFDNGLEITGKIFHSNGTKCYFLNNATYEGELN
jgi:hypothetical protein